VPQRRRKKRLTGIGAAVGAMRPIRPDALWAMNFQFDITNDGRTLKMLNVIDEFTRECLTITVDRSIDADYVIAVLDRLVVEHAANGCQLVAETGQHVSRVGTAGSIFDLGSILGLAAMPVVSR
jgi:putative transposase